MRHAPRSEARLRHHGTLSLLERAVIVPDVPFEVSATDLERVVFGFSAPGPGLVRFEGSTIAMRMSAGPTVSTTDELPYSDFDSWVNAPMVAGGDMFGAFVALEDIPSATVVARFTPAQVIEDQGDNDSFETAQPLHGVDLEQPPIVIVGALDSADDTDLYRLAMPECQLTRVMLFADEHVKLGRFFPDRSGGFEGIQFDVHPFFDLKAMPTSIEGDRVTRFLKVQRKDGFGQLDYKLFLHTTDDENCSLD
jgi:hypothetical protein